MFKPGQSGNSKGRPKGSKNIASKKAKQFIEKLLTEKNVQKEIRKEFLDLNGRELLKAYTDLLRFVIPTQTAGSMDVDLGKLSDEQVNEIYEKILAAAG